MSEVTTTAEFFEPRRRQQSKGVYRATLTLTISSVTGPCAPGWVIANANMQGQGWAITFPVPVGQRPYVGQEVTVEVALVPEDAPA
jgi:hypothetical protein